MYKVEKLALGGEGIALDGGKRIFIPLSAPGDVVEARVVEDRGSWARAEIVDILEASPARVLPRCKHYGRCGGCSLQHLSYEAQLAAKKSILEEALQKPGAQSRRGTSDMPDAPEQAAAESPPMTVIPSIQVIPPIKVISSKPFEYRNRVSLHAIRSNRFPRCGFKEGKGDKVIPLDDCPVLVPELRHALPRLMPPPGKDRFTLYGKDDTLIAETGACVAGEGKAAETLPGRGSICLSAASFPAGGGGMAANAGTSSAGAAEAGTELTRRVTLEAGSFFQSNAEVLSSLIARLRAAAKPAAENAGASAGGTSAGKAPAMADLYAGVGTFSLFLYDMFPGGVDLLESDAAALNLAKQNLAAANTRGNCRFFPERDEQWAKKRNLGGYSFVVADPPRQGLSPALTKLLCQSGPPVFVYISCDPATFARDFHLLSRSYRAEGLFLFDFYPQTAHIETMGIFSKQ